MSYSSICSNRAAQKSGVPTHKIPDKQSFNLDFLNPVPVAQSEQKRSKLTDLPDRIRDFISRLKGSDNFFAILLVEDENGTDILNLATHDVEYYFPINEIMILPGIEQYNFFEIMKSEDYIKIGLDIGDIEKLLEDTFGFKMMGGLEVSYILKTMKKRIPDKCNDSAKNLLKFYSEIMKIDNIIKLEECLSSLINETFGGIHKGDDEGEMDSILQEAAKMKSRLFQH